jgi:hypothetical protein
MELSISQCCVPFPASGETLTGFPEAGTVQPPAITFQAGVAPLVPLAVRVALCPGPRRWRSASMVKGVAAKEQETQSVKGKSMIVP